MQQAGVRSATVRLLIFSGDTAVLSCTHKEVGSITRMLNGRLGSSSSQTLLVSGTVLTIKQAFGLE